MSSDVAVRKTRDKDWEPIFWWFILAVCGAMNEYTAKEFQIRMNSLLQRLMPVLYAFETSEFAVLLYQRKKGE